MHRNDRNFTSPSMLTFPCFEEADNWLISNTAANSFIDADFGLERIARHFGKCDAVVLYWEGAAKEDEGKIDEAILLYKRAFKMWPALDSIIDGGLPRGVRALAETAGLSGCLMYPVSVPAARETKVVVTPSLLSTRDLDDIEAVWRSVIESNTLYANNPENVRHDHKFCTFLNDPPICAIRNQAPQILYKMN